MKKTGLVNLIVVGLFFLFVGCDSSEPIPKSSSVKIKMMMTQSGTSSSSVSSGRIAADTIIFSKALLGISELEFKTLEDKENHGDCDSTRMDMDDDGDSRGGYGNHDEDVEREGDDGDKDEAEFKGDFVFDLIHGTSTPNFEVTPGVYKKIEVKTAPILADGKSALIAFEVTNESKTFKVEFSTKAKMELELKRKRGFQVDSSSVNQILVLLKLDVLFANIDLTMAKVSTDGIIRINETSNVRLFDWIMNNLEESFESGDDHNHDGKIDDD